MGRFEGKTGLITGATSGIGRETARFLASEGMRVFLVGRNRERGRKLEQEILLDGGKARFLACDLSREDEVRKLKEEVSKEVKRLDLLFNNAGILLSATLEEQTAEDWQQTFAVNVDSAMYMTKAFQELLEGGCIVNDASTSGLESYTAGRTQYMYASSKAALVKFSKLCALNLAPKTRVNCICPGIIDTEIYTNRDFSRFDGKIPMGRIGEALEVAKLVAFLASDDAAYITGAVIPIDGGSSLL